MIRVHLGIRSKLLLAFSLGLATTLIAIALFAFHQSYDSLVKNTEHSVPFMTGSVELRQLGMEASAKIPRFESSKSKEVCLRVA